MSQFDINFRNSFPTFKKSITFMVQIEINCLTLHLSHIHYGTNFPCRRKIGHKSPDCDAMGVLIMYVRVFINLSGDIFMPLCKSFLDFHKQSKDKPKTTMKLL